MRWYCLIPGLLILLGVESRAQDYAAFGLTPQDVQRLQQRPQSMLTAMEQAQGGSPAELAMLREMMAAKPLVIGNAREIAGSWRCRMIKVGGLLPLTPYGFFHCRISGEGDRARLEKTTGSQRTSGDLLRLDGTAFVYRGTGYTDYVPRRPYGEVQDNNEVGLLFRLGRDRLRLEFPAPQRESAYNVMEFVRRK